MRKILFGLMFILFAAVANGQLTGWVPFAGKNKYIGLAADSLMYMPVKDTNFIPQRLGAYTMRSDGIVYVGIKTTAGGKHWERMARYIDATGGGSFVDSVKSRNDSLFYYIAGSEYFIKRVQPYGSYLTSVPGIDDVLGVGQSFTTSRTANGAGFNFNLYSASGNILFNTKANSTSYGSRLYLNGDSAFYLGNNKAYVKTNGVGNKLHIVTGQTSSDTTIYKPIAAQSSDGEAVLMTYWPGGGSGSQSLQQVTSVGDSTSTRIVTSDTLTADDILSHRYTQVGDSAASLKIGIYFGTSITSGYGVSASERYTTLTTQTYGLTELNRGVSGSTLVDHSPTDSSMFNRIYLIPTYSTSYGALFFDYGINDAQYSFDTTTFKTKYGVILDSAIARGWPTNKIFVLAPTYCIKSSIPNVDDYATATLTIAATKGVLGIDLYSYMFSRGGNDLLQTDSVHPTVLGHYVIENAITHNIPITSLKKAGFLEVKGSGEILDSLYVGGNVGIGMVTDNRAKLEISGNILQDYTGGTWGLYQQYLDGSNYKWGFEVDQASRKINLYNKSNGEPATNPAYSFITGTTTSPSSVLNILRNGTIISTGSLFQNEGDIISNFTAGTKFIGAQYLNGANYQWGQQIIEGAGAGTGFYKFISKNNGSNGTDAAFQFQTSTTGTVADVVTILRNGNVGINLPNATAKFHVSGTTKFDLGSDATGDMFYRDASGFFTRLPVGGAGQHLVGGATPHWVDTATGGGSGTVNSGTANRLAYYASTGTAVSELSAITANRALISDANGLPTHSSVTNTELANLAGSTTTLSSFQRMNIYIQSVGTDANITASPGTLYHLPSATLSAGRNFSLANLTTDGDYIEILNNEAGFTWTVTGATLYLIDQTTTVSTLTSDAFYQIRRINGKLTVIN